MGGDKGGKVHCGCPVLLIAVFYDCNAETDG